MSLLMDALKKAEEAKKDSSAISSQNDSSEKQQEMEVISTAQNDSNKNNPIKKTSLELAVSPQSDGEISLEKTVEDGVSPSIKVTDENTSGEQLSKKDHVETLYDGFEPPTEPQSEVTNTDINIQYKSHELKLELDPRENNPTEDDTGEHFIAEQRGYINAEPPENSLLKNSEKKQTLDATSKADTSVPQTTSNQSKINNVVRTKKPIFSNLKLQHIIYGSSAILLLAIAGSGYQYYQFLSQDYESQFAVPLKSELILPTPKKATQIENQIISHKSEEVEIANKNAHKPNKTSENSEPSSTVLEDEKITLKKTSKVETKATAEVIIKPKNSSTDIRITKKPQKPGTENRNDNSVKKAYSTAKLNIQKESNDVYSILRQAYSSFTKGNFKQAQKHYKLALQMEPNNRDALLGLAAIAVQEKDFLIARQIYVQILQSDPDDTIANAALLNIQTNIDPVKNETHIKLLLGQQPNSPHLLFSLGSLYTSQQRWADAHQAFLKAYQSQPKNADYAYNLAVTLDHMGQRESARRYYRTALVSANTQNINFSIEKVLKRINELSR